MLVWDRFLLDLEKELGAETFAQWLKPLKRVRFDARNLYLEAENPIQASWFEEHIRPRLKTSLLDSSGRPICVHINQKEIEKSKKQPLPFTISPDRIDPELSLDHFIPSTQNMVAYQLLQELNKPQFNPIYIYGPKYSGKSHLLNASALFLESLGKKVFFVRAETFVSHVVQSFRFNSKDQLRSAYRSADALIVDGIGHFAKKDATQEEFFHTFNILHTEGKQILLSADLPPSKLLDIEPRLLSRFEWGISLKIEPSDPVAILKAKASLWNLSYSEEVLHYLAKEFGGNSLVALQALSLRAKGAASITVEKAASYLEDLLATLEKKKITSNEIISAVASHYGIKPEDILGKSQAREYAYPRQIAMFLCREKLKLPFQKMGEIFQRDHSTVMGGVKNIQKQWEEKNGALMNDLQAISEKSLD